MGYQKTICVDFDGTLCEHKYPDVGTLKIGAREALSLFHFLGYRIVISSCRTSRWNDEEFRSTDGPIKERQTYKDMVQFIHEHDIPYDDIDDGSKGKPLADFYIDDRGIRFEDNWMDVARFVIAAERAR